MSTEPTLIEGTDPPPIDPPTAAQIDADLATARAERAELVKAHAEMAFAAISGAPDASERATAMTDELATLDRRIALLEAAHGVALARETEAAEQARLLAQRDHITTVEKMLTRRARYASELEDGITKVVRAHRLLTETSEKIAVAYPGRVPSDIYLNAGAVRSLVAAELHRQGAVVAPGSVRVDEAHSFPGGHISDVRLLLQPGAVPALTTTIEQANANAIAGLKNAVAAGRALPAPPDDGADTAELDSDAAPAPAPEPKSARSIGKILSRIKVH